MGGLYVRGNYRYILLPMTMPRHLHREVRPKYADALHAPKSIKTGYETSFAGYSNKLQPLQTLCKILGGSAS